MVAGIALKCLSEFDEGVEEGRWRWKGREGRVPENTKNSWSKKVL